MVIFLLSMSLLIIKEGIRGIIKQQMIVVLGRGGYRYYPTGIRAVICGIIALIVGITILVFSMNLLYSYLFNPSGIPPYFFRF